MGLACVVRLQVANVPARNRCTTGVQAPPTLSIMSENAERGNPVPSPFGQANREAGCWRVGLRGWNKQMSGGSGRDSPPCVGLRKEADVQLVSGHVTVERIR